MRQPERHAQPLQPTQSTPARLAKDVVPASVGDALRILAREIAGTARAYGRMIEWPKDVSMKQVTLASLDRIGFATVGVAVAFARRWRGTPRLPHGRPPTEPPTDNDDSHSPQAGGEPRAKRVT